MDETECRKIVEMVERRLQLLARRGPRWRQPTVTEVLSGTAFLRGAPPKIVDWIRHNSTIKVYPQVRPRTAATRRQRSPGVVTPPHTSLVGLLQRYPTDCDGALCAYGTSSLPPAA